MDALGRLDDAEHVELAAHLATCEECRATLGELRSTVGALDTLTARANTAPISVVPRQLEEAVLTGLHSSDRMSDHGRNWRKVLLACGSIAAVMIAAVVVSVSLTRSDVPTKTVALQGTPGVTATAVLVEKPWGTSLTIHEQGLTPGQSYSVSMDNPQGRWWAAGSYRASSSAPVVATMACAAQFASIYEIRVTDVSGRTVLSNDPKATY